MSREILVGEVNHFKSHRVLAMGFSFFSLRGAAYILGSCQQVLHKATLAQVELFTLKSCSVKGIRVVIEDEKPYSSKTWVRVPHAV